jgi:hypothetical protein
LADFWPHTDSRWVETATQTLHRLTSYEPGRDWDVPVDDPRVLKGLQVNDLAGPGGREFGVYARRWLADQTSAARHLAS